MTIDEAIKQLLNEAEKWDSLVNGAYKLQDRDCAERAADHKQLAEWLTEPKEARRLLKTAMEDMKILYEAGKDEGCIGIEFKWRYADEALKLIGGSENGTCV